MLIKLEVKLRGAKPLSGIASRAYFFQASSLVLCADDSPLRLAKRDRRFGAFTIFLFLRGFSFRGTLLIFHKGLHRVSSR